MLPAAVTPYPSTPRILAIAVAATLYALPGAAQTAPPSPKNPATNANASAPTAPVAPTLAPVTVTATRLQQNTDEVAATVSVIDAAKVEAELVTDIRDLVRYEPGISVRSAPSRFTLAGSATGRDGNAGFAIRGVDGNRVLIQTDGIRLPQAFSFGGQNFGRGDYLDVDLYKSVEIVRGPASAAYGSDGLAGAVSFATKDAADFVNASKPLYAALRAAYASADRSRAITGTAALAAGSVSLLAVASVRDGEQTRNFGTNTSANATRTAPNPQQIDQSAGLFKLDWALAPLHTIKLAAERLNRDVSTDGLSAIAPPPLGATSVIGFKAEDAIRRERFSVAYQYAGQNQSWLERLSLRAYRQDSRNRALGLEDRNTAADRVRDSRYQEDLRGISAEAGGKHASAGALHTFAVGIETSESDVTGVQDGVVPPFGETFPLKRFPDTQYRLFGAYAVNEILFANGLSITPALRYDRFELNPRQGDPQFPDAAPKPLSDSAATPRLGVVYRLSGETSVFAQYARGFLAPTPSQVNNGFTNAISFYQTIANPDLRPESSNTIELGIRGRSPRLSYDLAIFSSRYEDFIFFQQIRGNFTPASPAIFQSVNLGKVTIRGAEAKVKATITKNISLSGSYAYARGDDRSGGQPLDTIDPQKLVLAAQYKATDWGAQAVATRVEQKRRLPNSPTPGVPLFASPAYQTFDAYLWWRPLPQLTLNAALLNLGDKKHWVWQDVRGVLSTSASLDAFTQPGRTASIAAKWTF